jgi:hypothetical protein
MYRVDRNLLQRYGLVIYVVIARATFFVGGGKGVVVWCSIVVCQLPSSLRSEDPPPKAQ